MPTELGTCVPRYRGWAPPVLAAGSAGAAAYARTGRGVERAEGVRPMDQICRHSWRVPGGPLWVSDNAVGFRLTIWLCHPR